MLFDILTLFPGLFSGVFDESIVRRAIEAGIISIRIHNIRDYAEGRHSITDDAPYGGGGGMVMKPEPIFGAVEHVLGSQGQQTVAEAGARVILLSPQGMPLTQQMACELSRQEHLVLVCGRYEGVDERIREHLITDEISIGDYVLSGGEIPAMVVIETVTRLIPGVLGDPGATFEDSHMEGLLEYPHYTRPVEYRGWEVPEVLLSGDHALVVQWRREQALRRTLERRPELLRKARLSERDMEFLRSLGADV